MAYELIAPTDTRLNGLSSAVAESDIFGSRVQAIVTAMTKIALGERDEEHPEKPSMVGLAAPQIGAFERIILFDHNAEAGQANFDVDLRFIINPIITWAGRDEELGREGCYSTSNICGAVFRSAEIQVTGLDEKGKHVHYGLHGFLARIVQHEIDHLNGIRFPDRVRQPEHLHMVDKTDFQNYRENWAKWDQLCPVEGWLKLKSGNDGLQGQMV